MISLDIFELWTSQPVDSWRRNVNDEEWDKVKRMKRAEDLKRGEELRLAFAMGTLPRLGHSSLASMLSSDEIGRAHV